MKNAVTLAESAKGKTSPNPLVGAIIVQDGKIVGQGYHKYAGDHHAEINAFRDAGDFANGATLYVTLEPCSTFGRTPPCTDAIINAGIKEVIIGSIDPNPAHSGRAVKILEKENIKVFSGIQKELCDSLNEAFFCWIKNKKPFVLLKMAMTLDGKIATEDGQSQWITGKEAREYVQSLRQWADAIMVGGETVRKDNPSLTVRTPANWKKQPKKIIFSRQNNFDKNLNIFADSANTPEFICPSSKKDWTTLLKKLAKEEVTALLIEGGGETAATVLSAGIVDKVEFIIAPKILGGRNSRPVVGGRSPKSLAEALNLRTPQLNLIGGDIKISGYLN
ncbi:MAG: bifunctional diaminohydroxyphosphoribosylaminopyrimidine deaminase/5-amino-6-(5-phosphoribosylamino)uracil reductase RibD [Verrucomicrobiota bacterium]|nr:bifunctional diaminohydroxyphosphoribosylaminopyrimidine deaminase/5-amino-6-(5-phosphoribosylamino)uracil reductase RibD [Verrucomicrobiota bacterium]